MKMQKPLPLDDLPAFELLADDPEFKTQDALLSRLKAKHAELSAERETLVVGNYLRTLGEDERKSLLERRKPLPTPTVAQPDPAPSRDSVPAEVARALPLLDGHSPSVPWADLEHRLKQLDHYSDILGPAVRAQSKVVDEIRQRKSGEIFRRARDWHARRLVEMYRAAQQLGSAVIAMGRLSELARAAGYEPKPHLLARGSLPAAFGIGFEDRYDSQISRLRRDLEEQGLI